MSLEKRKAQLCKQLQTAVELELTTLPPYLSAYFSMEENTNIESASLLRTVFMEEMLHMCLVGNVMVSIGGKVKLGEKNIPSYPCKLCFDDKLFRNRKFRINLERFSLNSIKKFCQIELPDSLPPVGEPENLDEYPPDVVERFRKLVLHDVLPVMKKPASLKKFSWDAVKKFTPMELPAILPSLHELLPGSDEVDLSGYSIGDFYQSIIDELEDLDVSYREAGQDLFSKDISNQITETYFWRGGGKPIAVTDMASARHALNTIIDQGEGSDGSLYDNDGADFGQEDELSHYFKFNQIYQKRYYDKADDPQLPPTGEAMAVDYDAVYPTKTNPRHKDYRNNADLADLNREFNQAYSLMLQQIEEAFAGNPRVLYNAIMNGMHDLSPIARAMAKIQIDPSGVGETGAPTFEWVQPVNLATN